jgi:catechol 2,3-dioxygenase-like lactoylglutathione lyase family enzyme
MVSAGGGHTKRMKLKHRDFGIITPNIAATQAFYVNHLGFQAVYEADWYVHLKNGEIELGLMAPGLPTQPAAFQQSYGGAGVWISFEVEDVDAEYERLQAAGVSCDAPPQDRPWGERQFVVRDPNGFALNIAKSIPADPAFYA